MSEIIIGSILFGAAYLLSNQEREGYNEDEVENVNKEGFIDMPYKSELSMDKTTSTTSNQKLVTQNNENLGNVGITHNNMVPFFSNKSNGHSYNDKSSYNILDNHTGAGSYVQDKKETKPFFNSFENKQNIYGTQNKNEFISSRINGSSKFSNNTPWYSEQVGPGDHGFNNANEYARSIKYKNVDDLRISTNPKTNFENKYMSPAYKPSEYNPNSIGEVTHKKPTTFRANNNVEAFGPAKGHNQPMNNPLQMMTNENRSETSKEYFGPIGNTQGTYSNKSEYKEPNKIQLGSQPLSNLTANNIHPVNNKHNTYELLNNNRSINNNNDYYGNVKSNIYSNLVSPVVSILKPTKKRVISNNRFGNMKTNVNNPTQNTNIDLKTTNREMNPHSLNHYNVQNQNSDGYQIFNGNINGTNRNSTNVSYIGNAKGVNLMSENNTKYSPMIDKTVEERMPSGNTNIFNNNINMKLSEREQNNNRGNAVYKPSFDYIHPNNTRTNQQYKEREDISDSLVKGFIENPYTHSLNSVY